MQLFESNAALLLAARVSQVHHEPVPSQVQPQRNGAPGKRGIVRSMLHRGVALGIRRGLLAQKINFEESATSNNQMTSPLRQEYTIIFIPIRNQGGLDLFLIVHICFLHSGL